MMNNYLIKLARDYAFTEKVDYIKDNLLLVFGSIVVYILLCIAIIGIVRIIKNKMEYKRQLYVKELITQKQNAEQAALEEAFNFEPIEEIASDVCKACGAMLLPNVKFCKNCGAKVEKEVEDVFSDISKILETNVCHNCGAVLADGVKFCKSCGAKVNIESVAAEEPAVAEAAAIVNNALAEAEEEKSNLCSNCGNLLAVGVKFCKFCGTKVEPVSNEATVEEAVAEEINEEAASTEEQAVEETAATEENFEASNDMEEAAEEANSEDVAEDESENAEETNEEAATDDAAIAEEAAAEAKEIQESTEEAAEAKNICKSCGAELIAGARFCMNCGNKVEAAAVEAENVAKVCPNCGKEVSRNVKFCKYCGTKLG